MESTVDLEEFAVLAKTLPAPRHVLRVIAQ
jgi:hypothetical protein